MNDTVVRLTFPAKADYLLLARLALAGLARSLPLDPELVADLKLAVTEACGNAVRHAYTDSTGPIMVEFVTADDRLEMIVEDRGSGFDGARSASGRTGSLPRAGWEWRSCARSSTSSTSAEETTVTGPSCA